jgi:hypothetical protein
MNPRIVSNDAAPIWPDIMPTSGGIPIELTKRGSTGGACRSACSMI